MDPSLAHTSGNEMDTEDDFSARCPPPSLVPRLHVVSAKKLTHINPLINSTSTPALPTSECRELRETLRSLLEEAFMGDALAAELMILHLMSSVYMRQDVIALGKYSINISGITKSLQ